MPAKDAIIWADDFVFLVQDDIDRHEEGCDCGFCDSFGKSYGVSARSIFAPDEVLERFYGCAEDVAMSNALIACRERPWRRVEYDGEVELSGSVTLSLEDVMGIGPSAFSARLSVELTGTPFLSDASYEIVAHEGKTVTLLVEGRFDHKVGRGGFAEAIRNPGQPRRFRMYYHCPVDGEKWEDEWDCACNDRCPKCNAEIEPYHYEELAPAV